MVVRSTENGQVGESVKSDGVRRSGVSESDGVTSDGSSGDRVGGLGSEEETITSDDLDFQVSRGLGHRSSLFNLRHQR